MLLHLQQQRGFELEILLTLDRLGETREGLGPALAPILASHGVAGRTAVARYAEQLDEGSVAGPSPYTAGTYSSCPADSGAAVART